MIVLVILIVIALIVGVGAIIEGLLWMFLIGVALWLPLSGSAGRGSAGTARTR